MKNKLFNIIIDTLSISSTIFVVYWYYNYTNIYGISTHFEPNQPFGAKYRFLLFYALVIVASVFLSYRLARWNKWLKENKILIWGSIFLASIVFSARQDNKRYLKYINTNGGIIKSGRVVDVYPSKNMYIVVKYSYLTITYEKDFILREQEEDSINIGDTILVLFSKDYPKMAFKYKLLPTPDEISKCRDGGLYKNRIIADE